MRVRVFNIDDGSDGQEQFWYQATQVPAKGELIYTDDGDWLVQEVTWIPEGGWGLANATVRARFVKP